MTKQYHQYYKIYSNKLKKHRTLIDKQLKTSIEEKQKVLKTHMKEGTIVFDPKIIEGVFEAINLLQAGYLRTGMFCLSRTFEETLDLFIEKRLEKRIPVGITKLQYQRAFNFTFEKKIDFFSGKEISLRTKTIDPTTRRHIDTRSLLVKFPDTPWIHPSGTGAELHFIRRVARNPGAHNISDEQLKKLENELQHLFTTAINVIIDTMGRVP